MSVFLGMRGTGDWATHERPESWREGMLRLYPNGSMLLTALTSMMKSESLNDPHHHWWYKTLASQAGSITAGEIYTDSAMSSAVGDDSTAGTIVYCKVTEAVADEFRKNFVVLLRDSDDPDVDVVGEVVSVTKNGASSKIAVRLLEDDDNSASHGLSDVDRIVIIGPSQAEGAPMPDAIAYNPTEVSNYAQIFEYSLDQTRTAIRTRLRTGDAYKEAKREALELIGIGMEKAFIWGIPTENIDPDSGKKRRTTGGLVWFIKNYASDNVDNYTTNTDFSGYTWKQAGEDWIDEKLERVFRYGASEKLAMCGSGALLGLQKLAKSNGNIQLVSGKEIGYGIKLTEWVTSFGTIYLKTHPLFSYEPTNRNSIIILEPKDLVYRYIDDVFFKPDPNYLKGGSNSKDGRNESFLAEALLEFHFPEKCGYLNGVGLDNELS